MDYAADVSVGMNSIEGREFKTNLTLDKVGTCFPIALYTERPTTYGQNAIKLFLLACKRAPGPARETLHPGAFRPRKTTYGWVTDPCRNSPMWQAACKTQQHPLNKKVITRADYQ